MPSASGVFIGAYTEFATNDIWGNPVVAFPDSATRDPIDGIFRIPSWFVASPEIVIVWTAIVTIGNVVWDFQYRAIGGNDAESLDQATAQEAVTVTDAAPAAANNQLVVAIALTAANFAVEDTVEFEFARDGVDAADTMAATALLFDLYFRASDV
ncbi:MAG: hypothetical protein ACREBU_00240 [Nitrososphaera sp.]